MRIRSFRTTIYSCVFLRLKPNDSLASSTHHACTFSSALELHFLPECRGKNVDSDFQTINISLFCVCVAVGGYAGNAHAAGNFHWSYHMWKGRGIGSGRERGSRLNEVVGANESPQCTLTYLP